MDVCLAGMSLAAESESENDVNMFQMIDAACISEYVSLPVTDTSPFPRDIKKTRVDIINYPEK